MPRGVKWNFSDEELLAAASKYTTRIEWSMKDISTRNAANMRCKKFYRSCVAHMKVRGNLGANSAVYTDDELLSCALKCHSRTEWITTHPEARNVAYRRGCTFYERCVAHMDVPTAPTRWYVYAFEFADHSAYVGATCDYARRKSQHLRVGPVAKYVASSTLTPMFKVLVTIDGCTRSVAAAREIETMSTYMSAGWTMLNVAKCGVIGGNFCPEFTADEVLSSAKKYMYRLDWYRHEPRMVRLAKRYGIYATCVEHTPKYSVPLSRRVIKL